MTGRKLKAGFIIITGCLLLSVSLNIFLFTQCPWPDKTERQGITDASVIAIMVAIQNVNSCAKPSQKFEDDLVTKLLLNVIINLLLKRPSVNSEASAWAVEVELLRGEIYCVDSTDYQGVIPRSIGTNTACR